MASELPEMKVYHGQAGWALGETAALVEKTGVLDHDDQEAFQHLMFVQQGDTVERLKMMKQSAGLVAWEMMNQNLEVVWIQLKEANEAVDQMADYWPCLHIYNYPQKTERRFSKAEKRGIEE